MNFTLISAVMPKVWMPRKLLLVMKLTTFLLIIVLVQASAKGYSQKISLNETNASLANVFSAIKQQSGYTFLYTDQNLDHQKITVHITNADIDETLKACFQNLAIDYKIVDKNILLKFMEKATVRPNVTASSVVIMGKVVNDKGEPLPGVTIKVKGTNTGLTTNTDGVFSFFVSTPSSILQFSFVGYITLEIPVGDWKNPATIILKEDISKLSEVQVIGYGTTTRRANTGDITTVDAKTIAQYPTTNVLDALQGTVPGMSIAKTSGNATSIYSVQIRNINGFSYGSPLYVVDGVIFTGGYLHSANNTSGFASRAYDAMSLINPDDIESISILKDADATAIYGSRGADGVILITTKKGKAGAVRVNASVYSGVNDVSHEVPVLNLQQYLQMRHEGYKNDGTPFPSITTKPNDLNYDVNGTWDTTRSTNWQKALIGGFGHTTKAQLDISGGSEQVQYRISGGYNYVSNLEHLGGSDQTANLTVNLNSATKDKKFSVSFSGGYLYDINTMAQNDLTSIAISMAPDAPALYTSSGALNFQNNTFLNPLTVRNYMNSSPRNNLTSSLIFSYKPITDLEVKLTAGYNMQSLNEFLGTPISVYAPFQTGATSYSTFTTQNNYAWSIEPQINYQKQMGKGKLLATAGASLQDQDYSGMAIKTTGYSSDLLLSSPTAGTSINTYYPYQDNPTKFAALFGRINYSWADKYYIDLTGRDDGSSNFGQNKQFHVFAAVGAGWIFSEESFMKNNLPFLTFGKLRGSYGSTGRDNIAPYSYLSTYSNPNYPVAYGGVAALLPNGLPNPDLHWETTKKAELGLELQFLKGRIAFQTNFYRNRTTGVLLPGTLPLVTGFNSIIENMPTITQVQGFDASLTTVNIKSQNFSWSTTFLFTRDRSVLVDFPGLATSPYANQLIIGQPVNIIKAYRFGGVNPQTGIYQIYDANGNFTPAPNATTDKTVLINPNPDFYGSVQNNITYKQFTLSFLFRYIKQIGRNTFYNIAASAFAPPGSVNMNFPTMVLNHWQKPGDITNIQRFTSLSNASALSAVFASTYASQSDAIYGDASYIRLQNVALGYTLPQIISHKLGMQTLQVFLQGDNLWTISGYNGLDPETQNNSVLPPLRVITAGLRLTL